MANRRAAGRTPWIVSRYRTAREEAAQSNSSHDSSKAPERLLTDARNLAGDADAGHQMQALAYATESIHRAAIAADPKLWHSVVEEAQALAISLTARLDIKPNDSKASMLFSDVFHAKGTFLLHAGDVWNATWCSLFAHSLESGQRVPPHIDCDAGARALSRIGLGQAIELGDEATRVRRLRLRGDYLEALVHADRALSAGPEDALAMLQLQRALCQVQLCASTAPLKRWREQASSAPDTAGCLLLLLYAYAVPSKTEARMLTVPDGISDTHKVAQVVHDLYNVTTPIEDRVLSLGSDLHSLLPRVPPEVGLVFLVCAARWLYRRKKMSLFTLVRSAYRQFSESLSGDESSDVLGLMSDMHTRLGRMPKQEQHPLYVYPDWARRTGYTAAIITRLAAEFGTARVRRLFTPSHRKKRLRDEERESLHALVALHLGRMKGPFMKIAQHAGYLGLDLSERIDGGLHELFDNSPSASPESVRNIVESELGLPLGKVFLEFSEEPIGCGSIGQVHRAVLLSGETVAVKVQYPGVEEAIGHDFWNLSLLCPIAKLLAPGQDWAGLLEEARKLVTLECDYLREAKIQSLYREAYEGHHYTRIPVVYHQFVTKRVLTTEYIDGASFLDYTASLTKDRNDRLVEALFEFVNTPVDGSLTYVDGNPGNFLFRDEHMYVLDFGSVVELGPEAMRGYLEIALAVTSQNMPLFRRAVREYGWAIDPNHFDYQSALTAAGLNSAGIAVRPDGRLKVNAQSVQELLKAMITIDGSAAQPEWSFLVRGQAALFCLLGHLG
ncbi:MAG: AarF/ABC1/UbiB kinase family protein, partial [Kofleriaceae bacterium]|nr:AarF/ABC1/UbiB kinase family protein [Kofleriaceae bacterium]